MRPELSQMGPYSLDKDEKNLLLQRELGDLTRLHYERCTSYRKILDTVGFDPKNDCSINEIPFIPVRLFKEQELLSVEKSQVIKTMTSSGTSDQRVSRIFLDQNTATNQTKVLVRIVSHFTGTKRLPLLIIDSKAVIKDRNLFSARGAGILGFSMLGHDATYALDDNMKIDLDAVEAFCAKHKGETLLLFGFTYMIWEYFYKALLQANRKIDLQNAILIHGGGWKKLSAQAVDNETFKALLKEVCQIQRVHSYYGMVEQTGSIFMECEKGFLHSSIFSDVIIRRNDFSLCTQGEVGLVELISLLPSSYPGHVILSEDLGEIFGEDDCACGRLGKYFKIHGRIQKAEARGCGDTHVPQ